MNFSKEVPEKKEKKEALSPDKMEASGIGQGLVAPQHINLNSSTNSPHKGEKAISDEELEVEIKK